MASPGFQVIVVRAWREAGGVRIRLLAEGGSAQQRVVGSIDEARDVLGVLLAELLVEPVAAQEPDPSEPPHTPD